jgi:PadR family transcriptional regulator, regulatory protein PadR
MSENIDGLTASPEAARIRAISDVDIVLRVQMARQQTEIMKGTLDLLVLKTLALEPRHGVGVADRIAQISKGTFQLGPGSLFPALHRLEQEGFIAWEWSTTPEGRRAKYYRITAAGQKKLAAEKKNWARVVLAIGQILAER